MSCRLKESNETHPNTTINDVEQQGETLFALFDAVRGYRCIRNFHWRYQTMGGHNPRNQPLGAVRLHVDGSALSAAIVDIFAFTSGM